jgi:hypothetical protein
VYAIYRPVTDILFPEEAATERGVDIVATGTARVMELSGRQVVKDVAELTALVGGVTACAVVLRITSTLPAGMVGLAALMLGLLPAYLWPTSGVRFIDDSLREVRFLGPHPLLALAAGVAIVAGLISRFVPRLRLHLLGAFGIGATALVVLRILRPTDGSSLPDLSGSELWPVIVGAGLFMYVWWLASMIFELSFVWHRHVRHEGVTSAIKGP